MFSLEKIIDFRPGKYSLSFHSLTTSILGLSFGLGLVGTHSASAFDGKLFAPDGGRTDFFGESVSLSGNKALVGSNRDDTDRGVDSGSAYVFDVTTGEVVRKLLPDFPAGGEQFGNSVSLDGNTALVGSRFDTERGWYSGSAYLFDVTTGDLLHKLTAPDGAAYDRFGWSVSLFGNTALVGSYLDDDNGEDSGSAYVFDVTTGDLLHKLTAPDESARDQFGYSVSLFGNTALVGSYGNGGSAYLFDIITGDFLRKLTSPDPGSSFGFSVSLSGNIALVGGRCDDNENGENSGSAYLFDATTGDLLHKLTAPDGVEYDQFGWSVALSGNRALVGSLLDDDMGYNSGSAYLFDANTGEFLEKYTAFDGGGNHQFGRSVSLDGDTALIGTISGNGNVSTSGAAYVFTTSQPVPEPLTILGAGTAIGFGTFFKRKLAKKNQKQG